MNGAAQNAWEACREAKKWNEIALSSLRVGFPVGCPVKVKDQRGEWYGKVVAYPEPLDGTVCIQPAIPAIVEKTPKVLRLGDGYLAVSVQNLEPLRQEPAVAVEGHGEQAPPWK